jgi:hypothetical protein
VLWFHKLFFRQPPTIVMNVVPLTSGQTPAGVRYAVEKLVKQGCRVLIEEKEEDLDNRLDSTRIELDFMTPALIQRVDEFKAFFEKLQNLDLVSVVWEVVGGNPIYFDHWSDFSE